MNTNEMHQQRIIAILLKKLNGVAVISRDEWESNDPVPLSLTWDDGFQTMTVRIRGN